MTALHGFLGAPSDWSALLPDAECPDWPAIFADLPNLGELADRLNDSTRGVNLVGYSMGGRIALHMLVREPSRWKRAVIVSASPGMGDPTERAKRLGSDHRWAERFRTEAWPELLADWNRQSVFVDDRSAPLERAEHLYDRAILAHALVAGSVAAQDDLTSALPDVSIPVLWVAGARDDKYALLARACAQTNPMFKLAVIPDAGHRVPWANPRAFRESLDDFLNQKEISHDS